MWPSTDSWVKKVVKEGLKLPFKNGPPLRMRGTIDSGKSEAVQKAIQEFLEKGVLERTRTRGFTSRLFTQQQGGKVRPIIDCKPLNRYMVPKHFKMENLETLTSILQKNDYLIKIDLKDAYHHVPIHHQYRKYLQIVSGGIRYQFKALPFGLNIAPQVFTRVVKAALLPMREQGIKMIAYLDDICIVAKTEEQAREQGTQVVTHLQKLGFIINQKKTCLVPKQKREFLGLVVDSKEMTLSIPSEKLKKIKREASQILKSETWPMRKLAATIGLMNSVCKAVKIGRLMTRFMYADVRKALLPENCWDNRRVKISEETKEELQWWIENLEQFNGKPLIAQTYSKQLWTDASGTGWGAVCEERVAQGVWSQEEMELTSNQRESLAILKGLEVFTEQLRGQVVKIHSDNMTAVSNVGHQGGTHSVAILKLTKKIWEYALKNKIWLTIQHIRGVDNILADQASRGDLDRDEYHLSEQAMQKIREHLGEPSIDLFASNTNNRCRQFMTRAEDAFSISWTNLELPLIHPPIKLIPRILRKLVEDQVPRAILVMPRWGSLPYFPVIEQMKIAQVVLTREDLVMTPRSRLWRVGAVSMIALVISGSATPENTMTSNA